MKRLGVLGLLIALAAAAPACSKDDAVRADLDAVDKFTDEMVTKIKSAADPRAGIAAAQTQLDAAKSDIGARMARIGAVRGFQINDQTKLRLTDSVTSNITKVMGLKLTYVLQTMNNKDLEAKLEKLIEDYTTLLKAD